MNHVHVHVKNDKGEFVVAAGSPERLRAEFPLVICALDEIYRNNESECGHGIDLAIEAIRENGIRDVAYTVLILRATRYGEDMAQGTLANLIAAIPEDKRRKMTHKPSAREALERLMDFLVEDVLEASDEEILAELKEDHEDGTETKFPLKSMTTIKLHR
jgi:hypothetical protein